MTTEVQPEEYVNFSHASQQTLNDLSNLFFANEMATLEKINSIVLMNFTKYMGADRAKELLYAK